MHRDIKPQNMLVGRRDHAFLADFGLTRRGGDTNFTRTGVFVGTLDYAAPEQIEGETPTAASDLCVYSFGSGRVRVPHGIRPVRGQSEAAVMLAHLNKAPRSRPRWSRVCPPRSTRRSCERSPRIRPSGRIRCSA